MKSTIYVAGKYSDNPTPNVLQALKMANLVLDMGGIPFVPHLFHFWEQYTPKDYNDWMNIDLHFLLKCDAVWKISDSPGARIEETFAKEHGIQMLYNRTQVQQFIVNFNG